MCNRNVLSRFVDQSVEVYRNDSSSGSLAKMSYSSGSTKSSPRTATATPCSDLMVNLQTQTNTSDYGSSEGSHVQQCVRCLHYGHDRCRRRPRCFRCGAFDHTNSSICVRPVVCLNCSGPHHSKHSGCPSRLRELTIQQLVHKQGLTRKEAVQMAASFGVDTSRLKSVAVQTDPPPADVATQTEFQCPDTTARNVTTNNNCISNNNINKNKNNSSSSIASCTSTSCAHDGDTTWKLSLYQSVPPPPQILNCWSTSYPAAPYPFYPVQIISYPAPAPLASQVHWNCDQAATTATNEYYTSY